MAAKLRSGAPRHRRSEKRRKRRLYGAIPSVSGKIVWSARCAARLPPKKMPKDTGLPKHSLHVIAQKRKPRLASKHPRQQHQHSAAIMHPVRPSVPFSHAAPFIHIWGHCHLPASLPGPLPPIRAARPVPFSGTARSSPRQRWGHSILQLCIRGVQSPFRIGRRW